MWTEQRDTWGAANFITGAGGFLQAVIYGYGGFRITNGGLTFNPTLPPSVTKLTIRMHYLSSSMDFVVTEDQVTVTVVSDGPISPKLELSTAQKIFDLDLNSPVTVDRIKSVVRMRRVEPRAEACDHRPYLVCLLLLVTACLYLLLYGCYR